MRTYDDWKLDNQWDEEARRYARLKVWCEDCDERYAAQTYVSGQQELYLCEACAERRDNEDSEQ